MKILYIAPIPPPVNGQSLASKVFLESIKERHCITIVNINKQRPKAFSDHLLRAFSILLTAFKVLWHSRKIDRIYFTISESRLGCMKDLFLYMMCIGKLNKMTIHLHGGAGMIKIMSKKDWLQRINSFFLRRMRNVIILGESHRKIYKDIVAEKDLFIVPNFAEDYLFSNEEKIRIKFKESECIEFLFLSNLIYGKGYIELLEAYTLLSPELQKRIKLNFAGDIKSKQEKWDFEQKIKKYENIIYHGIVHGTEKSKLFNQAHIFCLPTYYPFEGQPISILEAYASGCVVMTTYHSGIPDVFQDSVNGYKVEIKSASSIAAAIESIVIDSDNGLLHDIAINNLAAAKKKYTTQNHCALLTTILEN
jgi:glycosyltransferase involved in cell wall biosynthesis